MKLATIEDVLALEGIAKGAWMANVPVPEDREDVWHDVLLTALVSLQEGSTVTKRGLERAVKNTARSKARDQERFESL